MHGLAGIPLAERLALELLEKETLDHNQVAEIFKDVKKIAPRPQWLSSEKRPVSDLPPVAVPKSVSAEAPVAPAAPEAAADSAAAAAAPEAASPESENN